MSAKTLCVALKFDDEGRSLLATAESLAKRIGASIHLVHVTEDALTASVIGTGSLVPFPLEVVNSMQEALKLEAEKAMKLLVEPLDVPWTSRVLTPQGERAADLIDQEADQVGAAMILVAASPGQHRFLPRGLSCALTLMSLSKRPVLVKRLEQSLRADSSSALRCLVADDLSTATLESVQRSFDLAKFLQSKEIHHLYSTNITSDLVKTALSATLPANSGSPELLSKTIRDAFLKQLQARKVDGMIDSRVVASETVHDGISQAVHESRIDLVFFGRHQTFHKKPFHIGQMPFYAMLALPCPIVVMPFQNNKSCPEANSVN